MSNQTRLLVITFKAAYATLKPFLKAAKAIAFISAVLVLSLLTIVAMLFTELNENDSEQPDNVLEPISDCLSISDIVSDLSEKFPSVFNPPIVIRSIDNLDELTLDQLKSIARSNRVKGWNIYKKPENLAAKLRELANA